MSYGILHNSFIDDNHKTFGNDLNTLCQTSPCTIDQGVELQISSKYKCVCKRWVGNLEWLQSKML